MHDNFQEKFKDLYTKDNDGIYVLDKNDLYSAIKCLKVEDELSLEEKEKYRLINDELCKLDIITPIRTHGKLMVTDICRF